MTKQPSELQPLLDDPTTPGPLADALRAAANDGPSPAEIARLTASLGAALPTGALAPRSLATGAKTFGAKAVAAMVGAGIAAGVVAGVVGSRLVGTGDPEIQSGETTAAAPSASASALSSSSSAPLAPLAPSASAPLPDPSRPLPVATVTGTAPLPANPPVPSETALLDRGHQALRSQNAAAALAAAEEHARAYPRGTFAQEREVIAIEALVALGRRPEAAKRAARFRAAFPGSAHQARIDSLVGGP